MKSPFDSNNTFRESNLRIDNTVGKWQSKILWGLFVFIAVAQVVRLITLFGGISAIYDVLAFPPQIYQTIGLLLAVLLLILHAAWTLTWFRGLAFLLIAALTGLVFEVIGVNYGSTFGGNYVYGSNAFLLFGVPWQIPIFWAAFIYASYTLVSNLLFWNKRDKPSRYKRDAILLPFLILFDGLVIVAIDLIMDPLLVMAGNWTWLEGGSYYDIPVGNFVGWFMVATISTGVFRVSEYFFPRESISNNQSILLIPVVGYGILCLALVSLALMVQLPKLALIGFFAMFPIVIANIIQFTRWRRRVGES